MFRLGSKPQILTNSQTSLRKHPKPPSKKVKTKNVTCSEHHVFWKTLSSKVDLVWQLWPICKVENARTLTLFLSYVLQKLDFYDHKNGLLLHGFDFNPSSSWQSTFSFGAIWDLFLEEYIAFCDGFNIILKYDPKNDLLNKNDPTFHFSWEMTKDEIGPPRSA